MRRVEAYSVALLVLLLGGLFELDHLSEANAVRIDLTRIDFTKAYPILLSVLTVAVMGALALFAPRIPNFALFRSTSQLFRSASQLFGAVMVRFFDQVERLLSIPMSLLRAIFLSLARIRFFKLPKGLFSRMSVEIAFTKVDLLVEDIRLDKYSNIVSQRYLRELGRALFIAGIVLTILCWRAWHKGETTTASALGFLLFMFVMHFILTAYRVKLRLFGSNGQEALELISYMIDHTKKTGEPPGARVSEPYHQKPSAALEVDPTRVGARP